MPHEHEHVTVCALRSPPAARAARNHQRTNALTTAQAGADSERDAARAPQAAVEGIVVPAAEAASATPLTKPALHFAAQPAARGQDAAQVGKSNSEFASLAHIWRNFSCI